MDGYGSKERPILKKNRITTPILIFIFLVGLCLLLYPKVSNYWNSLHQTRDINQYVNEAKGIDPATYSKVLGDAAEHNRSLIDRDNQFKLTDEQAEAYPELLNISGNGIMGYIDIPIINVTLPIYHGTSHAVLQTAVGHLDWTSLPVGGDSTHCVLSGHRGLPSSKLFTDLDKLVVKDIFTIHILDETLTYEVDQILIVEPEDASALQIVQGADYCTLVTCTPYGINTHRMLVRGHRIENIAAATVTHVTADAIQIEPMLVAPIIFTVILLVVLISLAITSRSKLPVKEEPYEDE